MEILLWLYWIVKVKVKSHWDLSDDVEGMMQLEHFRQSTICCIMKQGFSSTCSDEQMEDKQKLEDEETQIY